MERSDLHTHSACSDGLLKPAELILRAHDFGVTTLSITDHDTLEAYTDENLAIAEKAGIRLIPGVEISTIDDQGIKAHILGLGVDPGSEELIASLVEQNLARTTYTDAVVDKLVEADWHVDSKSLYNAETTITKAHIARSVIDQPGNQRRLQQIFGRRPTSGAFIEAFLLKGQEFYVRSEGMMTPEQAVSLIHHAGGLACYAHPVATLFEAEVDPERLEEMILSSRVDAIEAEYLYFSKRMQDKQIDMRQEFKTLAGVHGLMVSGGSDFHGASEVYGNYVELGFANQSAAIQSSVALGTAPLLDRLTRT